MWECSGTARRPPPARPAGKAHACVRPGVRTVRIRPRRFPHEPEREAVCARGEPESRHLVERGPRPRRPCRGDLLRSAGHRDPAPRNLPGGPVTAIRPIGQEDREAVRALIEGTGAFKPPEVEVAIELVDAAPPRPTQKGYHPFVLVEEDGTVVSYACFGKNEMTAATFDLYWLATRADRRGKGDGPA